MGRFAQRKRTGGGPQLQVLPILLLEGFIVTSNEITAVFSGNVTDTDFDNAFFETQPDTFSPDSITQSAANELLLFFSEDITDQTHLSYVGTVPNIPQPQTVPLTIP